MVDQESDPGWFLCFGVVFFLMSLTMPFASISDLFRNFSMLFLLNKCKSFSTVILVFII